MPSTPPPLPHSPLGLSRIHWTAILASAFVSFALVVGVCAWIVAHPHKAVSAPQATPVVAIGSTASPLQFTSIPSRSADEETSSSVGYKPASNSDSREVISNKIPSIEVDPPSLPPPALPSPKQRKGEDAEWAASWQPLPPKKPAGETYGTKVLFLNNRETAADTARREHKLLFVMHISGNFEEACFT